MGQEVGAVDEASASMLKRVVKFGDLQVQEVMIPRTEVVWVEQGCTLEGFQQIYGERPLLRYPIYEGNYDNVVGMLSAKDVHVALAKGSLDCDTDVTEFGRPVYFIPRTKLVGELFNEMRAKGFLMAAVLSEYGGTSGIVTIRELVDEIVGEMSEELVGATGDNFEIVSEHAYMIDGSMAVEDANENLGLHIPDGDYETMGGFAFHLFGRLPEEGEQTIYNGLTLTATEVQGRRIAKLLVVKEELLQRQSESAAASEGAAPGENKR